MMTTKHDDGGPAMPVADMNKTQCAGLTLRDWFAGQALAGMISSSPVCDRTDPKQVNKPGWAKQAYEFADAMIAQRTAP